MDSNSLLDKLDINQMIRYAFGGGLLIFFAYICDTNRIGEMIKSMGIIFAPLFIIGLGVLIYVLQRKIIGEYFWYPIIHRIHNFYDSYTKRDKEKNCSSPIIYLKFILNINNEENFRKKIHNYFTLREAYTTIRRLFNFENLKNDLSQKKELRNKFNIAHAELHLLWIMTNILILFYAYVYISGTNPEIFSFIKPSGYLGILIFIIILVLILGIISADVHQLQYECRIIRECNTGQNKNKIKDFLKEYKF